VNKNKDKNEGSRRTSSFQDGVSCESKLVIEADGGGVKGGESLLQGRNKGVDKKSEEGARDITE